MPIKISEMISQRKDLANDLSAGIVANLDSVVTGYESFLAQTAAEGDPPVNVRQQLVQLRLSIDANREILEGFDDGVVDKILNTDKVSSEVSVLTEKVTKKLRFARDTTRNLFGPAALERTALKEPLPRRPLRISERAQLVQSSFLSPKLNIQPVIDLSKTGEENAWTPAILAQAFEPESSQLDFVLGARYAGNRENIGARALRQEGIKQFDRNMRGIVRIVQGMFLLADRDDLVTRFSTSLRRFTRRPNQPALPTPPPADDTTQDSTSSS